MSINLHCEEATVWQTPTWVTEMCMSRGANGRPDGGWKGVLRRYKIWLRAQAYEGGKLDKDFQEAIEDHLKDLDAAAKKKRSLTFYSM